MRNQIDSLIDKHNLTHIKRELLATVFPCVKVIPRQEELLPIGCSKMGGLPDVPSTFEYPTHEGKALDFIAQFNLADLQDVGMEHDLPKTGMLYFFYNVNDEHEDAWCVQYDNEPIERLQRVNNKQSKYTQCTLSFNLIYKLPELFIEDEADSDRFLQLLEELIPDHYDNHQVFGEPFSVQGEVFEEAGEYTGIHDYDMTLLFQIDSDYANCHMTWGDLGMLYFCIGNEDLKQRRFENTCCILQSC
ncbi:YwqG family protein [Bacillus cereus]|uniref:YwqG family protein n=1 Tax=Bacillus cereus TaxID=1396 RepID=UPI00356EBF2D